MLTTITQYLKCCPPLICPDSQSLILGLWKLDKFKATVKEALQLRHGIVMQAGISLSSERAWNTQIFGQEWDFHAEGSELSPLLPKKVKGREGIALQGSIYWRLDCSSSKTN